MMTEVVSDGKVGRETEEEVWLETGLTGCMCYPEEGKFTSERQGQ
jgi:hypothetical protein